MQGFIRKIFPLYLRGLASAIADMEKAKKFIIQLYF